MENRLKVTIAKKASYLKVGWFFHCIKGNIFGGFSSWHFSEFSELWKMIVSFSLITYQLVGISSLELKETIKPIHELNGSDWHRVVKFGTPAGSGVCLKGAIWKTLIRVKYWLLWQCDNYDTPHSKWWTVLAFWLVRQTPRTISVYFNVSSLFASLWNLNDKTTRTLSWEPLKTFILCFAKVKKLFRIILNFYFTQRSHYKKDKPVWLKDLSWWPSSSHATWGQPAD